MSKSAHKAKLEELHSMLAEVFMEDLKQSREDKIPLPAANLNAIRQFLKDNDVSASIEEEDMKALKEEFADELASRRAARQQALENALSDDDLYGILE